MLPLTVTGAEATIRWGYHRASSLRAWTVTRDENGVWQLVASVVSTDTYRLSQRPLVFEVPHQNGVWRWPVLELQMMDDALTAHLGPKE